jgi:ribonuclease P protein component
MSSYERINVETLKKNYEFSRVYRKGKYFSGKYLTINVLESIYAYNRIGVSVSRKVYKSSVKRNLYRRRIKEILRTGNFNLKKGYDIVFVVKKTDEIPKYQDIEKEIIDLLIRAKLIIKDEETNNQID